MTDKPTNKNTYTFEDIKVGDTVKVTVTSPIGTVRTTTGVATNRYGGHWEDADRGALVSNKAPEKGATMSLELVSRPSMPVTIGTIIKATLKSGAYVTLARVDQTSDDDDLLWLELSGTGDQFHSEDEILDWTEMALVEAL